MHLFFAAVLFAASSFATSSVAASSCCTPTQYVFSFLWSSADQHYQVHGLWPETCAECVTCGYPSCCANTTTFVSPEDDAQFIAHHWYNSTSKAPCLSSSSSSLSVVVPLFQHEYQKHGTCLCSANQTPVTSTEYLATVETLFDRYDPLANTACSPPSQPWLYLDAHFELQQTRCV